VARRRVGRDSGEWRRPWIVNPMFARWTRMNSSGSISAARPSTLVGAGALGLATFALALAGMTFTRNSGGVALVWPVNVLVLARLLRIDRRWWLPNVVCLGQFGDGRHRPADRQSS